MNEKSEQFDDFPLDSDSAEQVHLAADGGQQGPVPTPEERGSYFAIDDGKGFHMQFDNGWRVSVQFGWGNYCRNKSEGGFWDDYAERNQSLGAKGCPNAEVAAFDHTGEMIELPGFMFDGGEERRDVVSGWNSANKVLELLNWAASQRGAA